MKTPIEFDYDLWTTEDGKFMVRVKATGESCEVDRNTMRLLRCEEKRLRRSQKGAPVAGCNTDEKKSVLSLDYVSVEDAEEMIPAWLDDHSNIAGDVETKAMEQEFRSTLTDVQRDIYIACILGGQSYKHYAAQKGVSYQSVQQAVMLIRKKAKKFFL